MVHILLFASLAQQAGMQKVSLEIAKSVPIVQIRSQLQARFPSLKGLDDSLAALNEEYVDENEMVKPGDTIAFIPPVSGG
jgi:sulfur-carrier protein